MGAGSTTKTEASLNEAETFYKRGELDNCIGLCRSVLRGSPDNWRALQYLAQVAYVRKRYSQALSLVTRALSVAPEAPVLFNLQGAIYRALGELGESRSSFHNAVDLDPRFAAAHDNLGLVLRQMSDLAPALRSHKTAVALCPDRPEFKLHLGQALEAIGRADEALA